MPYDHDSFPKGDILVVDDRADNLRLLANLLNDQGYKVRKVIKGELTFDVAVVNPPDLILLDIIMPDITGFEICQQLKADGRTQAIPVIFLSALDEPLDKVRAFAVGGEDYITKPFEIEEVVVRIEHQLRLVRMQRQLHAQNQQLQSEIADREKAETALQQINQELETRIAQRTTEITQANRQLQTLGQQLKQALDQEQALSQLKSQIITAISHEYRTPMAIISSSVGVLENYADQLTVPLRQKHFFRIQAAIQRMTDLIDDVIFLNYLEFGNRNPELGVVDLKAIAQGAIASLSPSQSPSHDIQVLLAADCQFQTTDARLITKILLNLLSNAIKFSPANPNIKLQIGCDSKCFFFIIQDQGIGIPEADQDRILESFYRAANAENIQGVGLGLTIVKKCVDLLGGQISIVSTLNQETTVTVSFPIGINASLDA
ncbi:hybrid sensor histidine kinase/response regulator [Nodosilinea sp. E11]|uniref:hybrid sensor histidine kinase/response regulator n=1 Tax=Nodosilinea sp. E11 TaxID=3037479 RepID=UPI002934619A|nr:hybrid sensor histidine kinase/response regulator [Nodosilinea sp. E11]WOD40053.1 hybrid sensor histidine kinase/response regulator [Nodosilinea sp. E11]